MPTEVKKRRASTDQPHMKPSFYLTPAYSLDDEDRTKVDDEDLHLPPGRVYDRVLTSTST